MNDTVERAAGGPGASPSPAGALSVVLAGGGTAGHVEPAMAVADALAAPPGTHDAIRSTARETVVHRYDLRRVCLPGQVALVEEIGRGPRIA